MYKQWIIYHKCREILNMISKTCKTTTVYFPSLKKPTGNQELGNPVKKEEERLAMDRGSDSQGGEVHFHGGGGVGVKL